MQYLKYFFLIVSIYNAQVTGLAGWDLFIDPGHSQDENMGINGYSEAKEVLQVGLELRDILNSQSDIDTVYISRTTDNQSVSLYQRTNYANTVGASWYHSIHSDASSNTNTNRTLLLWGQLNNGNPDPPVGGEDMSSFMIDILTQGMRIETTGSWGDCSFYTWSDYCANSGGPYLYVNRNTNMPSELSEEGHHTNPAQNQLVMNAEYKRMLAYLFFYSILDYHEIDRPFVGQLAGQILDIESQEPINGSTVQSDEYVYITDTYNSLFHQFSNDEQELRNGFYWFEGLSDSTYEVIVSAPGYYSDTTQVSILDTFITFHDVELLSSQPPIVMETVPVEGDSLFPAWDPIEIQFSRPMDTASVIASIVMSPATDLEGYYWYDDQTLILTPDPLLFETNYTLTIFDEARDVYGHYMDGDQNGEEGGDFHLLFKTGPADMVPPEIENIFPPSVATNVEIFPIINIQFDETLDTSIDLLDYFLLERFQDHSSVSGDMVYYPVGEKSSICYFPDQNLYPNEVYVTRLYSGITDIFDNVIEIDQSFSFQTRNFDIEINEIDNLEQGISTNWWGPQSSGSTTGIIPDSTWMQPNSQILSLLYESSQSMEISYGWDLSDNDWLIRVYLSGGPPRDVIFNDSKTMQAYVFGDGSGNKFRFCVDDNLPSTSSSNHEVSPWYIIDWVGWKLISWDMDVDGTGEWIGDGNLNGNMRFDSFQMSFTEGQSQFGSIYIDDLSIINNIDLSTTGVNDYPSQISLGKNFPNPFNMSTEISFTVDKERAVQLFIYDLIGNKIAELVKDTFIPGQHRIRWNGTNQYGNDVSSGIYIYTIVSNDHKESRRMILIK